MGRLEIQDKPRFKESASNHVPSKFSKTRDDRVSNLKLKTKMVLVRQRRSLLAPSVERVILVSL